MGTFFCRVGKMGVGLGGLESGKKMKVLRMKSSIVENVPTSDDIIFKLSLAPQLPYNAQIEKIRQKMIKDFRHIFLYIYLPIFL